MPETRPRPPLLPILLLNGLLILVMICLVELISYTLIERTKGSYTELAEFMRTRPEPYKNFRRFGTFYSEQFDPDSKCRLGIITYDQEKGFPEFEQKDLRCDTINLRNGWRVVTAQPATFKNTIYIFGGSTVFGSGSDDDGTIPSQVQKKLIESGHSEYIVKNLGFAAVVSGQQLKLLKNTAISRRDVVIFYDGANDIWQGVIYGRPSGTIIGYNKGNRIRILINKIRFFLSRNSNFYRLLHLLTSEEGAANYQHCEKSNIESARMKAQATFDVYKENIIQAKRLVEKSGGAFIHVFQPSLFSRRLPDHTEYERSLIRSAPSGMMPCKTDAFREGYLVFKDRYWEIEREVGNAFDLSETLDSTKASEEYFIDWVHVAPVGNEVISDRLVNDLIGSDFGRSRKQSN